MALLDHPDSPAVIIPGLDNPVGKRGIKEERFFPERCVESRFRPGKHCNRYPPDRMRRFTGTGLVTDTGHESTTTSHMSQELIKFFPEDKKDNQYLWQSASGPEVAWDLKNNDLKDLTP